MNDRAVFLDTAEGIMVILGCAHAGVINTLQAIRQRTGNRPIHSGMGGVPKITNSNSWLGAAVTACGIPVGITATAPGRNA